MKVLLLLVLIIAMLWSKYTGRTKLFEQLRIAGLIAALVFLIVRLMG